MFKTEKGVGNRLVVEAKVVFFSAQGLSVENGVESNDEVAFSEVSTLLFYLSRSGVLYNFQSIVVADLVASYFDDGALGRRNSEHLGVDK